MIIGGFVLLGIIYVAAIVGTLASRSDRMIGAAQRGDLNAALGLATGLTYVAPISAVTVIYFIVLAACWVWNVYDASKIVGY